MPSFPALEPTISGWLVVLVASPWLLAAGLVATRRWTTLRARAVVGKVGAGLTCALALIVGGTLARRPSGAVLLSSLGHAVWVGRVPLSLDLQCDLPRACALVVATVLVAYVTAMRAPARARVEWANALVGALVLTVLADSLLLGLVAGHGAAAALWQWRLGGASDEPRRFILPASLVGTASCVLGVLVAAWGGQRHEPGFRAEVRHHGNSGGAGSVTLTYVAGATVYLDGRKTSIGPPAPFVRAPVTSGVHRVRVRLGEGLGEVVLSGIAIADGDEVVLLPDGPTESARALGARAHDRSRRLARVAFGLGLALVVGAGIGRRSAREPRPTRASPWVTRFVDVIASVDYWVIQRTLNALLAFARALAWIVARLARRVIRRGGARGLIAVLAVVSGALWSSAARAAPLVVSVAGGGRGPVELLPRDGGYVGEAVITNEGPGPVILSRVAVRCDGVRPPPHVSASFVDGAPTTATLAPGAHATVRVAWMPPRDVRAKQVFGHVIVTTSEATAREIAIGFRARVARPWSWITDHALTWLVFLPVAAALGCAVLRVVGIGHGARRVLLVLCMAAEGGLGAWVAATFDPAQTRGDGSGGLQLVDRVTWIEGLGAEYFVGVDGTSVASVVLVTSLALIAALASFRDVLASRRFHEALLLLVAGMIGVLVAQDALLFVVCWGVAVVALALLVRAARSNGDTTASTRIVVFGLAGVACLLTAALIVRGACGPVLLADGRVAPHGFSFAEWRHVGFSCPTWLARGAWVLLCLAFVGAAAIFPFHDWLVEVVASAVRATRTKDAGGIAVGVLGGALFVGLGPYALARWATVLPVPAQWAAGTLVAFGSVTVAWGALCALAQRDLARFAGYAFVTHMGFAMMGGAALTPEGHVGVSTQLVAHGLAAASLILAVVALRSRAGTTNMDELSGLAREAPCLAIVLVVALLASAGTPGLVGFWGEVVVLLGVYPEHPGLALLALAGGITCGASHILVLRRLLLGPIRPTWRAHPLLEPFGGRVPDLRLAEAAIALPLVAGTLLAGLWPAPLLSMSRGAVERAEAPMCRASISDFDSQRMFSGEAKTDDLNDDGVPGAACGRAARAPAGQLAARDGSSGSRRPLRVGEDIRCDIGAESW